MHHIWSTAGTEVTSVRRAALKVKLLCNGHLHATGRKKQVLKGNCCSTESLCRNGTEDTTHFLLRCTAMGSTRKVFIIKLRNMLVVEIVLRLPLISILQCETSTRKLIMDCSFPDEIESEIESYEHCLLH